MLAPALRLIAFGPARALTRDGLGPYLELSLLMSRLPL